MAVGNADVVRANSEAFSRKDVDGMLELYAPDAAVVDRRAVGWGEHRGHDAMRSYYLGLFDNVEGLDEELEIVSEEADVIVADCRLTATLAGQPGAPPVEFAYALRIVFADGVIRSMDIHEDAAAAQQA